MSDNLVINPLHASLNYSGHFPFGSLCKSNRWSSRRCFPRRIETIRSSQKLTIFYSKLFMGFTWGRVCRRCQVHFLARRYPKGKPQLNGLDGEIADKYPKGKPHLSTYFRRSRAFLDRRCRVNFSQMPSVSLGADRNGRFDLDSFRIGTAVNQAKNIVAKPRVPHSIATSGTNLHASQTSGGRGRVKVELLACCRK